MLRGRIAQLGSSGVGHVRTQVSFRVSRLLHVGPTGGIAAECLRTPATPVRSVRQHWCVMARLFHRPAMVFALAASQMASAGVCEDMVAHTQPQPTVQLVATATPTCVCQASGYSTKLESERSGWCRSCGYMLLASARSRPVQDLSELVHSVLRA